MNEELGYLDAELKGMFVEEKYDEMKTMLKDRTVDEVKEISSHNWGIIKKYYDNENFDLLVKHIKFVAFSCFMIEYVHDRGLIADDAFGIMMSIYTDIQELLKQQ